MTPVIALLAALAASPGETPAPAATPAPAPVPGAQKPLTAGDVNITTSPFAGAAPGQPLVTKASAEPGAAGLDVVWAANWDEAVAKAKKIPNGRILLYFYDEACAACSRMEGLVIPSTSFYAFTRDKVPVREWRSSAEGQKLAERLHVTEVPAWVVVTPDLVVSGMHAGSDSQLNWIGTFIKAEEGWAKYRMLLDDEAAHPQDRELVFRAARETFQRGGDGLAEPRFRRLAEDPKTPVEIREQSLAYVATIEMDNRKVEDAARHLNTLLKISKNDALRQRAELRLADIEVARGHIDLAIQRLEKFKKTHPESPMTQDADALMDFLKEKKKERAR